MKTRLLLLLIVFFSISSNLMAAFPTTGDGTIGNPYIISTATELASVRDDINAAGGIGKAAAYYELSNNIDMSGTANWSGIGLSATHPFKGQFNGKGFKITGLKRGTSISRTSTGIIGLFGLVDGVTISNLELDVAFYTTNTGSSSGAGLIAQVNGGTNTINNCKVTGTLDILNTHTTSGNAKAAGIAGQVLNASVITITNTSVDATIIAFSEGSARTCYAAGFISEPSATATLNIVNCYAAGLVSAKSTTVGASMAGGILASGYNTTSVSDGPRRIINCYAANSVDGYTHVGGIAANMGANTGNQVTNCIALNEYIYGTADATTYRISPLGGATLSANYAKNALYIKAVSDPLSVTSLATGIHGETMSAIDTKGVAKTKLNNYVNANITYNGIALKKWVDGDVYPIIGTEGGNVAGTAANPYKISTAAELIAMRNAVNTAGGIGVAAAYYELTADIDLSATANWDAIGTSSPNQFKGNFNGKGFKITGVKRGTSGSRNAISLPALMGLFGLVNSATISNLEVDVAYYLTRAGSLYGGGLVAQTDGGTIVINNCKVTGTVDVLNTQSNGGYAYASGVVGQISSTSNVTIINTSVDATLIVSCSGATANFANAAAFVADVAAAATLNIVNCNALGAVTATSPTIHRTYAGGILASAYNANTAGQGTRNIINCYAANTVDGYSNVGGIAANMGNYTASQLNNCIALNTHIYGDASGVTVNRISPLIGSILSNNYALNGLDIKTGSNPVTITSSATGVHGETLSASDPAGQTLTKLNAYVAANPTYGGLALKSWVNGQTYPAISNLQNISSNSNTSGLDLTALSELILEPNTVLTIDKATRVKSITIQNGGKLTNNSSASLTANTLLIESSASGTGTYVDNGTSSISTATVQQYLPQGRNWYIGTPVSAATNSNLAGAGIGTSVSHFDEVAGDWVNDYTGSLTPGKGYISVSSTGTATNNTSFIGTLNTGDVAVTLTRTGTSSVSGYNLIANPFPSYLNAMDAIAANTNLEPTIWYRTRTAVEPLAYKFETVNVASGVGTNKAATGTVTGYIPPMQAFWVRANLNNQVLILTNDMREHAGNVTVGAGTVPTTPMKAPKQNPQSLIRIKIAGVAGSDETVIYSHSNALNEYDKYDSKKRFESSSAISPEVFTQSGSEKLAINGLNEIQFETEIPLGFVVKQSGDFSISTNEITNLDSEMRILLKDKRFQNTEFDLTEGGAYNFSSEIETQNSNRFSLVFRAPGTATAVNNIVNFNAQVFVNIANKITIQGVERMKAIVYNSLGQKLNEMISTDSKLVDNSTYKPGVYFVEITANGNSETHKVIIR